jgi:hypothetical protein
MKKLALLAGLTGILAVNALADQSSHDAEITVNISSYINLHMGMYTAGTQSNNANTSDVNGNTFSYTVDTNAAWTSLASFAGADFAWFNITSNVYNGVVTGTARPGLVTFDVSVPHSAGRGGSSASSTLTITVSN